MYPENTVSMVFSGIFPYILILPVYTPAGISSAIQAETTAIRHRTSAIILFISHHSFSYGFSRDPSSAEM